VPELQRLGADHASGVLAFELANRSYFAGFISDRGDEYFELFADRQADERVEQDTGECAYYVLVADDGSIIGRFNLRSIDNGSPTSAIGSPNRPPVVASRRRPSTGCAGTRRQPSPCAGSGRPRRT
jgi:hypothetical protein